MNWYDGSFGRGFLLAELMHPKMMKEKMHDTVKHTNAKFGYDSWFYRDQEQQIRYEFYVYDGSISALDEIVISENSDQ
ncbi:MAG: hypothetical protein HDQ97_19530 [Lachnospiraceae bacterium]|nr:hypothetical protein [Lachnospiraceae bacterium]